MRYFNFIKFLIAIVSSSFIFTASFAINQTNMDIINEIIQQVPAASASNLADVFNNCSVKINYDDSYFEQTNFDNPENGIKAGDKMLDIYFSLPVPSWDADNSDTYNNLEAIWLLREGKFLPFNGWAKSFQYQHKPIPWQSC